MINYDDDPRYEFVEEGVYFDTQTNETVIVLDEEASNAVRDLIVLDDTIFDVDGDDVRLTSEGADKLFQPYLECLESVYDDDSDLNDL